MDNTHINRESLRYIQSNAFRFSSLILLMTEVTFSLVRELLIEMSFPIHTYDERKKNCLLRPAFNPHL
ncbi:hypothetical protein EUGRSUZ_A02442 [Eucalyptus grandis]|uniref:Uncharacterized protein n=2 Tax=Eucalyptus grandis TaxID=71139 RepID=A0ACC3M7B7_EUCGR|nr:hypothetical protein EUGRSUZ_A02442 [Eucalyptus grandis]